jgi:hypothetical protein
MYEFESFLKQGIITLSLERAGFGTIRHTLPPGMSLSVPILADQAWDAREIADLKACVAWSSVAAAYLQRV